MSSDLPVDRVARVPHDRTALQDIGVPELERQMIAHIDDRACLEQMRKYVAWPAWRRWLWRTLGH